MNTKLYLIRHAEAEGNIFRRMDGHYNSRITQNGQRQIKALAERFADVPIDAVYASDLFRTCETAKAIYVPKGLPLHKDARFREVMFGTVEDINFGYIDRFAPEQNELFSKQPERWFADGAETYFEATDRFLGGLRALAEENPGKTLAVFTHGAITAWSLRRLFGGQMPNVGRCDNTGVCLLEYQDGTLTPELIYDNSHLPKEISTLEHQKWWRGTNSFNLWFREAKPEDAALFDPAYPMPRGEVKIAMRMDEPVGYLSVDRQSGEITSLYLVPQHRHKRMGDQLMGEIVCPCRDSGLTALTAKYDPSQNEFLTLLTRHGAVLHDGIATMEIGIPEY